MTSDEKQSEAREKRVPALNHASGAEEPGNLPGSGLDTLYQEHSAQVLHTAYRVTGNMEDAEDVLHTVFCRLLAHERKRDLSPSPGGYLRRAAINAALDLIRSPKSRNMRLEAVEYELSADVSERPDKSHEQRETTSLVRRALEAIAPKAAEMFALKFFEGYGNREIAQLVGTSPGAVAVTIHRARAQVREELRSLRGESPEDVAGETE